MSTTHPNGNVERAVRDALREKRFDDALTLLEQAACADPDDGKWPGHLGTVCTMAGRTAEAAMHFRRATQLDPTESSHYVNLGAVLNRLGEHAEAAAILLQAIKHDPRVPAAFYNLGIAYRRLDKRAMAISAYREAIRLDPHMAEAHQNLGNVYLAAGNVVQAITEFERAIELKPGFQRAIDGLAKAREAKETQASGVFNPFGRLADPQASQRMLINAEESSPRLSSVQQVQDREQLHELVLTMRQAGADLRSHLNGVYIPALTEVQRLVTRGRQQSPEFAAAAADLVEARSRLKDLRRALKARSLRLRAHEELVGTDEG